MKKILYYTVLCVLWCLVLLLMALLMSFCKLVPLSYGLGYALGAGCAHPQLWMISLGITLLFRSKVYNVIQKDCKVFGKKTGVVIIVIGVVWLSVNLGIKMYNHKLSTKLIEENYPVETLPVNKEFATESSCFENDIIQLHYNPKYRESKIQNAPHMLVKLSNDEGVFSISCWDYGIDDGVDVWDDNIYEMYSNNTLTNSDIVMSEKVIINIKNETIHAIKKYENQRVGTNIKLGTITYIFVKNGLLFVSSYNQPKMLSRKSSSKSIDDVLKELVIKNVQNSLSVEEFEKQIIDSFKEVNKTLPAKIDEVTTLYNVLCIGKTLMFKYRVEEGVVSYMDDEWEKIFKTQTVQNMMTSVPDSKIFASYMSRSSLKMVYSFYDNKDNLLRTLQIQPEDFK